MMSTQVRSKWWKMLYREVINAFHYWDGDGAMVGIVGMVVGIAGKGGNTILGAEGMDGNGGKVAGNGDTFVGFGRVGAAGIVGRGLAAGSGGNVVDCGRVGVVGIAGRGLVAESGGNAVGCGRVCAAGIAGRGLAAAESGGNAAGCGRLAAVGTAGKGLNGIGGMLGFGNGGNPVWGKVGIVGIGGMLGFGNGWIGGSVCNRCRAAKLI
ncbi:uncharacterized protein LOC110688802 [Chenopodium quinoa]|uniref:uncharacterized protein LOC110688802 n=1 Tax=Chenopodium quinoa TaxID=63459 RepID=UPI000B77F81B|nr:uncharacterized protein LOC110688802 [Chenopodium quinoa]